MNRQAFLKTLANATMAKDKCGYLHKQFRLTTSLLQRLITNYTVNNVLYVVVKK